MAVAQSSFSHQLWTDILQSHVQNGKVDYAALKKDARLERYLKLLETASLASLSTREDAIAFWINAYNAYTLKLIVDNYPLKSIRDATFLGGTVLGFVAGPWKKAFCKVAGKTYSLDEIEHDILRKQYGEARIHFAVNCASESCPILRPEAYSGEKLKSQLDDQLKQFLSDTLKNKVRLENNTLYLSKLFDWYGGDFTASGTDKKAALIQYLLPYFPESAHPVLTSPQLSIEFLDYDWSLNDAKK